MTRIYDILLTDAYDIGVDPEASVALLWSTGHIAPDVRSVTQTWDYEQAKTVALSMDLIALVVLHDEWKGRHFSECMGRRTEEETHEYWRAIR